MRSRSASSEREGDPDRGELAGSVETGEVAGVKAIGLDAPTDTARDERWCDDFAMHSEGVE